MAHCNLCPLPELIKDLERFGASLKMFCCYEKQENLICLEILKMVDNFSYGINSRIGMDPLLTFESKRKKFSDWLKQLIDEMGEIEETK